MPTPVDTFLLVPDYNHSTGKAWFKRLTCSRYFGRCPILPPLSCCCSQEHYAEDCCLKHNRCALSCQEHCTPCGCQPSQHMGQWHIPEQIPAQDSRAVSYISRCRTVSTWPTCWSCTFLSRDALYFFCLIFLFPIQGWLLSSHVALCRRKAHSFSALHGCISPAMQAVVQGASGEKRDLCAAFFLIN